MQLVKTLDMSSPEGFVFRPGSLAFNQFDLGGVLYHGNYFHLYEATREAWLQSIGLPYCRYVERAEHLAVTESQQSFLSPIFYGDEIEIVLSVTDLRSVSFTCLYEISRNNKVIHRASTSHAFVGPATNRKLVLRRLPDELKLHLKKLELKRT